MGFYFVDVLQQHYASTEFARDAIFIAAAILLLFVPVPLFVAGSKYFGFGWRDKLARSYWQELLAIFVRSLWWLVGGVAGFILVALAERVYAT